MPRIPSVGGIAKCQYDGCLFLFRQRLSSLQLSTGLVHLGQVTAPTSSPVNITGTGNRYYLYTKMTFAFADGTAGGVSITAGSMVTDPAAVPAPPAWTLVIAAVPVLLARFLVKRRLRPAL